MPTAQEILKYREQANNGTLGVYYNDSILHATVITTGLIRKAIREKTPLNIFCGELSLFKKSAKPKIDAVKIECSTVGMTENQKNEWDAFNPHQELITAFSDLANDDEVSLNIILEHGNVDCLKEESIWTNIQEHKNTVHLYLLRESMGLDHFTVTKDAYRIENSDKQKSASGSFNDSVNASLLNETFSDLKTRSVEYII